MGSERAEPARSRERSGPAPKRRGALGLSLGVSAPLHNRERLAAETRGRDSRVSLGRAARGRDRYPRPMPERPAAPEYLAIDLGTSSVKAGLVDARGEVRVHVQGEAAPVSRPQPGWAEQHPDEWWAAIRGVLERLATLTPLERAAALVFTGQSFGALAVDAAGQPLAPCLTWQDTRSRAQARQVTRGFPRVAGYGLWRLLRWLWVTNGAPNLAGRDPLTKMLWLREERPELWARTHKLLDVKDSLLLRCTGRFVTTPDIASATWLMDTRQRAVRWAPGILAMTGIPADKLPELVPSTSVVGELLPGPAADLGLPAGLPVVAGAGDVIASATGSGAVRPGACHLYLGTSAWAAAHLERRGVDAFAAAGTLCAAEAGRYLFTAGQEAACAALEWARGVLPPADFAAWDAEVEGCEPGARGALFLPWLSGERCPMDEAALRGGFLNLDLEHTPAELRRAVYEGIACNLRWALEVIEKALGGRPPQLRLVGGGSQSTTWCQILTDVCGLPTEQVAEPHLAGVRGAGLIAAVACGELGSLDEVEIPASQRFLPQPEHRALYEDRFESLREFARRSRPWFQRVNR